MLLPYEKYLRNKSKGNTTRKSEKPTRELTTSAKKEYDVIRPRQPEQKPLSREVIVISPEDSSSSGGGSGSNPQSLSISLMMSKQRGRPSKKFRNQIERLRTKQTMKLEEERGDELKSSQLHQPHGNAKFTRYPPRKQTWVNPLNVDIASRQNPEVPMTSPGFRYKDKKDNGSDVELISPRRHIEVHSPLRQGRRIYSSTKESVASHQPAPTTSSSRNGYISEAFVPILPRTAKPPQQSNNRNELCEFKIQSVRSLASTDDQPKRPPPASPKSVPAHPPQYMHYPYNTASFEYAPVRQYYSLNESAKLVPVTMSAENRYANDKSTFRDAGFSSMRTIRHDIPPEINSYKIKSSALKNHEPYIIHHPSHVNRTYREIPGQYPVIYTHHPERFTGKNERHNYRSVPTRTSRFVNTPVEIREYSPANNGGFVYERVQPRHYEKVSPRIEKMGQRERPSATTYVQYIEEPGKQHKWAHTSVSTACNI